MMARRQTFSFNVEGGSLGHLEDEAEKTIVALAGPEAAKRAVYDLDIEVDAYLMSAVPVLWRATVTGHFRARTTEEQEASRG